MPITPLYQVHLAFNARMTDFCGWTLPLSYGSQIAEHHAVRRSCGMFDISHMAVVDIGGKDAFYYLCRLLANDVSKLKQGRALYSLMLNDAGGILDDLIVYHYGSHYRLVVNACATEPDIAWMHYHVAAWGLDVAIAVRRDLAMLAVQGPNARAAVSLALPQCLASVGELARFQAADCGDYFIACTGYTGEDGLEIYLPQDQAEALWVKLHQAGVSPCGLGARDTLRLEAGFCLYGQDMDANVIPAEAGLDWTVDRRAARDFIGRTALASRMPRWHLLGLILAEGGILRHGQLVKTTHGEGSITSGSFSPTLERSIALARLPLKVAPGNTVLVEIRGKEFTAQVVKPPFVRQDRILV